MTSAVPRKPRAFESDDPGLEVTSADDDAGLAPDGDVSATALVDAPANPVPGGAGRGARWGALLVSALAGLVLLAAVINFTSFVSVVLIRDDWLGWTAVALVSAAGLAVAVMLLREIAGLVRLARLSRLRKDVATTLRNSDVSGERRAVRRLRALYRGRDDLKWAFARLKDHEGDVHDAGDLLRLADRELMTPLDQGARRAILKSAKRVTVATAISPMMWIAMLYVAVENLRLLKTLAALYGGRPGGVGAFRLARMVVTHIVATGGLAMTDDLLGQFLGQDLLRRISRRLGEGVFNGALTARIGCAAVEVTRPLPFLDAPRLRVRDLVKELLRTPETATVQTSQAARAAV